MERYLALQPPCNRAKIQRVNTKWTWKLETWKENPEWYNYINRGEEYLKVWKVLKLRTHHKQVSRPRPQKTQIKLKTINFTCRIKHNHQWKIRWEADVGLRPPSFTLDTAPREERVRRPTQTSWPSPLRSQHQWRASSKHTIKGCCTVGSKNTIKGCCTAIYKATALQHKPNDGGEHPNTQHRKKQEKRR